MEMVNNGCYTNFIKSCEQRFKKFTIYIPFFNYSLFLVLKAREELLKMFKVTMIFKNSVSLKAYALNAFTCCGVRVS